MNTLAYGLLSLLSHAPYSGYDLMLKIQPFWPAKHSQIYPLLAQLEANDYVRHVLVAQTDKPDKKVYSLTDTGRDVLRSWLSKPADEPVTRDELTFKLYCMDEGSPADIRRLLELRNAYYRDRLQWLQGKLEFYQNQETLTLGIVLLLQKACLTIQADLQWSEWALEQLPKDEKEPKPQ